MKRKRVMVTMGVLAALVGAFFFLPLPVSRVRDVGMVQVSEGHREAVHVVDTAILTEIIVHDGQTVERGMDLAWARSREKSLICGKSAGRSNTATQSLKRSLPKEKV